MFILRGEIFQAATSILFQVDYPCRNIMWECLAVCIEHHKAINTAKIISLCIVKVNGVQFAIVQCYYYYYFFKFTDEMADMTE